MYLKHLSITVIDVWYVGLVICWDIYAFYDKHVLRDADQMFHLLVS